MKKRSIILFILLILMAITKYTQAWTLNTTNTDTAFYNVNQVDSKRTLLSFTSSPIGKNKILMNLEISAPSSGTANLNITLQPLNSSGALIQSLASGCSIDYMKRIGTGSWDSSWTNYATPSAVIYFDFDYQHTTTDKIYLKVIFTKPDIATEYYTSYIELRDY